MSEAYPQVDAWEDSSIGLHGGHNRMPWIVVTDETGDSPYAVIRDAAPIGAIHPLPDLAGLVVTHYDTPELLGGEGGKTWRVNVNYGPATDRTIGLWRRSVRFASEVKPLEYSLPEYRADGSLKTPRQRIGSYSYKPIPADPPPQGATGDDRYVRTKSGGVLLERNGDAFAASGHTVNSGITALVYEILVPQLPAKKVAAIGEYKWYTNAYAFLGYPRWTLQFSNFAIDDEVLSHPGNRGTTAVWYSHVMFEILYKPIDKESNPHGFRAERHYEEWVNSDGLRVPVFRIADGEPEQQVIRTIVKYPEVSFNTLFGIVGYGSPAN